MGKDYQEIDERMQHWIEQQHVFFVATAPLGKNGLVNCSPKGLDSLRILGPRQIAYADTGGSGIETVAHLNENGRIVVMLCAFTGRPKIFRFYGRGEAIEPHDPRFESLRSHFAALPAVRNLIVVDVERIRDSCGYGVPNYEYAGERDSLANYYANQDDAEIRQNRIRKNEKSLDGLPGLDIDRLQ